MFVTPLYQIRDNFITIYKTVTEEKIAAKVDATRLLTETITRVQPQLMVWSWCRGQGGSLTFVIVDAYRPMVGDFYLRRH